MPCDAARCRSCGAMLWKSVKDNMLLVSILFAVIGGIILGFALRPLDLNKREIMYVGFLGQIFLRMLKLLILPLIISSLISGLAGLDTGSSGKLGWMAVAYYMCTTMMAVILGIILVYIIHPGQGDPNDVHKEGEPRNVTIADTFLDLVRAMFPDNLVNACFQKENTVLIPPPPPNISKSLFQVPTTPPPPKTPSELAAEMLEWDFKLKIEPGMNLLGLVVFSVAFGIIIARMGEDGRPLKDFFVCLSEASMKLVYIVMWFSPIGILFLVAAKIVEMKSFAVIAGQLGMYTVTVIVGLCVHGFIILPLMLFIFTRRNPLKFVYGVSQAILTAVGTASSSATLPVTISCLEEKLGVDSRVVRFVLPVGATINMDGTALYEAVAVLFVAQVNDVNLNFGQVVAVSITATAASVGAAGVPQAGLVTMAMVLTAVGLPLDNISLILAVDWFLDRLRTGINVLGDSIGAGIVGHYAKRYLPPPEPHHRPSHIDDADMHELRDVKTNRDVAPSASLPPPGYTSIRENGRLDGSAGDDINAEDGTVALTVDSKGNPEEQVVASQRL